MVELYVSLIKRKLRKIENVPPAWIDEVRSILGSEKRENKKKNKPIIK